MYTGSVPPPGYRRDYPGPVPHPREGGILVILVQESLRIRRNPGYSGPEAGREAGLDRRPAGQKVTKRAKERFREIK